MLWGRCPEAEGVPAYWPWAQALRAHVERSDTASLRAALGPAAAQLARLVPAIREHFPDVPEAATVDPEESRFRLFDGVATFLQRLGAREPSVVVLDDLHWAEDGTMRMLDFVVPEIRRSRVLIVCTYREAEMRRTPRRLAQLARADERIALRGLDLTDAAAIVEDAAATAMPAPLVARLHRTTGGNPYFLHELLRWLRNEGRLTADHVDGVLPDEVRELLRRRVAPLADEDRHLLTMAAALGEQFEVAPLAAAAGLPAARVLEGLAAAESAGLVREAPGGLGRFDFVHALVRETLYRDLPTHRRVALHRTIARALEAFHGEAPQGEPVAELARHYVHAAPLGEAPKAVRYSTAAGEGALARAGYEEALGHYERALAVLRLAPPDPALEVRLRLAAADAAYRAGDLARAREAFAHVAARARPRRRPGARARRHRHGRGAAHHRDSRPRARAAPRGSAGRARPRGRSNAGAPAQPARGGDLHHPGGAGAASGAQPGGGRDGARRLHEVERCPHEMPISSRWCRSRTISAPGSLYAGEPLPPRAAGTPGACSSRGAASRGCHPPRSKRCAPT